MTLEEKIDFLKSFGWTVGERNPQINTDYEGKFMCVEPYDDFQLPTKDGANGPWAIVGNDLESLVNESYTFLTEISA